MIMLSSLLCAATILYNKSGEEWNDFDRRIIEQAIQYCRQDLENPCLKHFMKVEPMMYSAICGPNDEK